MAYWGLTIWAVGAGILVDRIITITHKSKLNTWSTKRKWFEIVMIFVGNGLLLTGVLLQIKGL